VLFADQLTKAWAVDALSSGQSRPLVGDLIRFQLAFNTGAAFSSGTGATWIFTVVSGVAAIAIVVFAWRVRSVRWAIGLGVLLGGAVSHFGDRLLRGKSLGNGYVIDFIDYFGFFIGNVADIAIVGAVVYLALLAVTRVPSGYLRRAQATEEH
jgi:signal peptidase II